MPEREGLPRWARILLRVVLALAYALIALAGVIGVAWPADGITAPAHALVVAGGALCTAAASAACIAVLTFRWRVEYVVVWWAGIGLVGYAGVALAQQPLTPILELVAALALATALFVIYRGVSLMLFEAHTRRARLRRTA